MARADAQKSTIQQGIVLMVKQQLPVVGAALCIEELPTYADWLKADKRDVEIQDAVYPDLLDSNWQAIAQEARRILDGHTGRIGIHGPFIGLTLMASDPKVRAVVVERLSQGLEFAQAIGGTHMVIHSPYEYFGSAFLPHTPGRGQADEYQLAHDTLGPVVELARQANVTLVIEDIFDLNSGPLLGLIRSFESEHVKSSIDVGHAYITSARGGPTPDQWVLDAGKDLAHLHLQDTDEHLDRHWRPGMGNLNWFALFESLAQLEHSPRLILELRDKSQIRKGAEWLRSMGLAR
jgi:sugar phosphate isomerase/epimerase